MSFTEAKFQSQIITPWFKKNGHTCAYEVKVSNGNTVRFGAFQPQQIPELENVRHGISHTKLTDASLGMKKWDGFCLRGEPAYVIILFNKEEIPRKYFYMIDIDHISKLKRSGAKSIKLDWAKEHGIEIDVS